MVNKSTMKYPIGVQSFEVLRSGGYVYVDKTDLIYQLAQNHVCFLCRPRRFGKSLMLSTLEAYFRGKKQLFEGLKIMQLESEWDEYPIFHLDFNGVNFQKEGALEDTLNTYLCAFEEIYGKDPYAQEFSYGFRFAYVLKKAHEKTGKRCVVLIDEYDKPLLDVLGENAEKNNREILKGFYSTFKSSDDDLRFVMLTGVTKFSQVSVFSGFNQPYDISLNPKFEAICGITESELHAYFEDSIQILADEYSTSFEDISLRMKRFYDGYHFSRKMTDIYNPFSVFNAFDNSEIRPYWYSTGTPTYLAKLLEDNHTNVASMLSEWYETGYFIDYRANTEDPLAMLYQSGYLTIKEVRTQPMGFDTYRLDYPNMEVKSGFVAMLSNRYFDRDDYASVIRQLVTSLDTADLAAFRTTLTAYLASIDYAMRKDKEYHFQYTLYLIFSLMSTYNVKVERHTSQGRADMIVETANHIYVFEFKLDGTAQEALQQINQTGYTTPYLADPRPLHKIGISFGKQSGTIDDWLEA